MRAPKFVLIYRLTKLQKELKEAEESCDTWLAWLEGSIKEVSELKDKITAMDQEIRER